MTSFADLCTTQYRSGAIALLLSLLEHHQNTVTTTKTNHILRLVMRCLAAWQVGRLVDWWIGGLVECDYGGLTQPYSNNPYV